MLRTIRASCKIIDNKIAKLTHTTKAENKKRKFDSTVEDCLLKVLLLLVPVLLAHFTQNELKLRRKMLLKYPCLYYYYSSPTVGIPFYKHHYFTCTHTLTSLYVFRPIKLIIPAHVVRDYCSIILFKIANNI